ncbi:MAG: hypothetical protein HOQ32_03770 [Lysobacter sp.]|nr:hypothetical protein [Lysobacter sp.]
MKVRVGWIAYVLVLTGIPLCSHALFPSNRPVERLYGHAVAVVHAKVVEMSAACVDAHCWNSGYVIALDQVEPYKGSVLGEELRLCSNAHLEIGLEYTLFLEQTNEFNSRAEKKCDLVVDFDGAFEKRGSHTYRVGSLEAQIIVDFEGDKYMTSAIVVRDFDSQLEVLSRSEKRPAK